ncbi:MAG: DUF4080 domain-containing protein [Bradymonadales bacterium]|nr:DUF4080 domain-containing protein [Bradymonadales bacterium]
MAEILLTTSNARYFHAAFGLRYLLANMGELQPITAIREFDLSRSPGEIAESLLEEHPRIVGIGVYLWNLDQATRVVAILKKIRPHLPIVLGGPEVSYRPYPQPLVRQADHVICGEGDLAFARLCRRLLANRPPTRKILAASAPDLDTLRLPYELYTDEDIAHRTLYVESFRGCPFGCEFCLSALDPAVRRIPLPPFLEEMRRLLDRGARHFKFVDRTFNLDVQRAQAILRFFLDRDLKGLFLHFEMVPDRLPQPLCELLAAFPPGSIQLELGVQTFDPQVAERIGRRQDNRRVEHNLRWLRQNTPVHLHTDLVVGLPGEDLDSIRQGFDRLVAIGPQEIQVGILKGLRGAPIRRHDGEHRMAYGEWPPYEILQTKAIDFSTMQRIKRLARIWDRVFNSGRFLDSAKMIWEGPLSSPFDAFLHWTDWLFDQAPHAGREGIALGRLAELLFIYLTTVQGQEPGAVAARIALDLRRDKPRDIPAILRAHLSQLPRLPDRPPDTGLPARQRRHRG